MGPPQQPQCVTRVPLPPLRGGAPVFSPPHLALPWWCCMTAARLFFTCPGWTHPSGRTLAFSGPAWWPSRGCREDCRVGSLLRSWLRWGCPALCCCGRSVRVSHTLPSCALPRSCLLTRTPSTGLGAQSYLPRPYVQIRPQSQGLGVGAFWRHEQHDGGGRREERRQELLHLATVQTSSRSKDQPLPAPAEPWTLPAAPWPSTAGPDFLVGGTKCPWVSS